MAESVNELFGNLDCSLSVRLSHIKMRLSELVSLKPDSLIEFKKIIESDFELCTEEKILARGNIIAAGDRLSFLVKSLGEEELSFEQNRDYESPVVSAVSDESTTSTGDTESSFS